MKRIQVCFGIALAVLAAGSILARPPVHVNGGARKADAGVECYNSSCVTEVGIRACYACCDNKCGDGAANCQEKCDGSSNVALMVGHDPGTVRRYLDTPAFSAAVLTPEAEEGIEFAYIAGDAPAARYALAVASDRLKGAEMASETRGALVSLILDATKDPRSPKIRQTAVVVLGEANLTYSARGALALADRIINDEDPSIRSRALRVLLEQKIGNAK